MCDEGYLYLLLLIVTYIHLTVSQLNLINNKGETLTEEDLDVGMINAQFCSKLLMKRFRRVVVRRGRP